MAGLFDQVVNYSPPLLTAGQVNYDGTWNASTNTPTLVNPPDALSKGDYYVVSVAGTQFSISFAVGDWIISNGTAWEKVDLTDAVSSVFGRTGAVVGDSTDYSAVGISNTAVGAANPSTGAFTSLSSSSTTTLNGTTVPASKTLVVTTDKLSALAATTSAELAGVISDETGSGALVFASSPTLVTPALGTPSALVGTNITGTAAAFNINGTVGATTPSTGAFTSVAALSDSGYQAVVGQLTTGDRVGISGQSSGSGAALVFFDNAQTTFRPAIFDASSHSLKISGVEKAAVTSTGLQGAIGATTPSTGAFTTVSASTPIAVASGGTGVTTSTGTTNVVLSNSPTLVTPILGTPQSGTLTSCTGLPISTGVSGLGTGIATALAVNTGSAGAPVLFNGALGTPTSGTVTNLTGTASININGTVGATTANTGAFTTLSASGTFSTGTGNGATAGLKILNGSTGVGSGYGAIYPENISPSATNYSFYSRYTGQATAVNAATGGNVFLNINDSIIATISSTGLAVTGALSSTTGATFATSSGNFLVGTASSGFTIGFSELRKDQNSSSALVVSNQNTGSSGASGVVFAAYGNSWYNSIGSSAKNSNALTWALDASAATPSVKMTLDTSGNLGIGVTPSAWSAFKPSLQVGTASVSQIANRAYLTTNGYYNGSAWTYVATDYASQYFQQNSQHIWQTAASGTAGNAITFTQAMTLDASGNLLVGGTSASYSSSGRGVINLSGSASGLLGFQIGGVAKGYVGHFDTSMQIWNEASSPILFGTNATERARIDSDGNLLVGTTTVIASSQTTIAFNGSSKAGLAINDSAGAGGVQYVSFHDYGTKIGSITKVGVTAAVIYNTTSDYRLKNITGSVTDSGTFIDALKPRVGTWKADGSKYVGFVAHEFAEVCPSAVNGEKDAVDEEGKPKYQSMQASSAEVIANLVAELQSVRQRLAVLESK